MMTKDEYYELILKNRELVRDPEVLKCTCPKTYCEWHGRCANVLHCTGITKTMFLTVSSRL